MTDHHCNPLFNDNKSKNVLKPGIVDTLAIRRKTRSQHRKPFQKMSRTFVSFLMVFVLTMNVISVQAASMRPLATNTSIPAATNTLVPTQVNTQLPTPTSIVILAPATSTPAMVTKVFFPLADAYVKSSSPNSNFGSSKQLLVDNSPIVRSYLSFRISGIGGSISNATLKVYANSNSTAGFKIYLTSNGWGERTINFNNAPAMGNLIGSMGGFRSGQWINVDITSFITGVGDLSLGVVGINNTAINFTSLQGGANMPQLVITTDGSSPTQEFQPSPTNTLIPTQAPTAIPTSTSTKLPTANPTFTFTPIPTQVVTATPLIVPTRPLHYAFNTQGGIADLIALGFNLFDISGSKTNPVSTLELVNALPEGTQALIWLGNLGNAPIGQSCPAPGFSDAEFMAVVDILANNPKVFGYNLADEPHPSVCPDAANAIKARSDYIHTHAPGQKTYITIQDGSNMCPLGEGCEYRALRPEITHIDLIGLDPYPCHFDSAGQPVPCNISKISQRVQFAIANGIPLSAIIPVYQAFGQEGRLDGKSIYYRTPTTTEFQDMLNFWKSLVPNPIFDIAYTWGIQCSVSSCSAPQSLKNHPELQLLIKQHNSP